MFRSGEGPRTLRRPLFSLSICGPGLWACRTPHTFFLLLPFSFIVLRVDSREPATCQDVRLPLRKESLPVTWALPR